MKTLLNLVEFLASLEDLHMEHQEVADNAVFYHEALMYILGLKPEKLRQSEYRVRLAEKEVDYMLKKQKIKTDIKNIIDKFK